jgi:hypothetical protein
MLPSEIEEACMVTILNRGIRHTQRSRKMRYTTSLAFLIVLAAVMGIGTVVNAAMSKEMIRAEWPEVDFHVAYDSFSKGDMKTAASEIRKGARFLKLAAARSSGKVRTDLVTSYRGLRKQADDIEGGKANSPAQLKQAFAQAHFALAEYYQKRLEKSWLAKDTERAGHDLHAATRNLEQVLAWGGQEAERTFSSVIKHAYAISKKLIEDTGWISEEVEKGIKDIGAQIAALRKKIGMKNR